MLKYYLTVVFVFALSCENSLQPSNNEYPVTCLHKGDYEFADHVVEALGRVQSPSALNDPKLAINGVQGNRKSGSKDVYSRGYDTDSKNHYLILEWSGRSIVNGEGADFVIFENAFEFGKNRVFMDQIVVSVSNDLKNWSVFPYDYLAEDETRYSADPADWQGFAGIEPTNFNRENPECISPFADLSGGDTFDLDSLKEDDPLRNGFRYLKLQSAPTLINVDTGSTFVHEAISDGFDLDGVYANTTELR